MSRSGRRSVRFRITATAAITVFVVLALAGLALVTAQRRVLTSNLDESLEQVANELSSAPSLPTGTLSGFGDDDSFAQVVGADGTVLAATANLAGKESVLDPVPDVIRPQLRTLDGPPHDEARFRVRTQRVAGSQPGAIVHVGGTLDDIDESTRTLARSLAVTTPTLALLLAALIWGLVGRTLRPVESIRAEVEGIGGRELSRRVPEPGTGDEVDDLARTMNAMLARLEESAERQQRFVADASHELRSPLTRMRTELEVDGGASSVLDEVVAMQRLVTDLLYLARSSSDAAAPTRRARIDLDDLVLRSASQLRAERSIEVDTRAVSGAQVDGDPDQLGRVVTNLLDNAGRHARSTVTVTLSESEGEAVLSVADDGPGIPPADRERIFERFTRLDAARTAGDGGSGLGLAITRDIVAAHGGTITVDPSFAPGARLVVRLPA